MGWGLREDGGRMQSTMRPTKRNSFKCLKGDMTKAGGSHGRTEKRRKRIKYDKKKHKEIKRKQEKLGVIKTL